MRSTDLSTDNSAKSGAKVWGQGNGRDSENVKRLIGRGVDLNKTDYSGKTALMNASYSGVKTLIFSFVKGYNAI